MYKILTRFKLANISKNKPILQAINQSTRTYTVTSTTNNNQNTTNTNQLITEASNSIKELFIHHNLAKTKKNIQPILENFLTNDEATLSSLINKPETWSLFYQNNIESTSNFAGTSLKTLMHLILIEAICTQQAKLSNPEMYLLLAESLYEYLLKYSDMNLNESNIHFGFVKVLLSVHCNYLEHCLNTNKQTPNKLAEIDPNFKLKLDRLDYHLKNVMKRYTNFDSINYLDKEIFIRAFSFFENKWLYSTNILLEQDYELNSLYSQSSLSNVLKGSIRFNRMETFNKLFHKLNEWNLSGNIINVIYPNQSVYKEFFNLKGNNLNQDLSDIFSAWESISYVPSQSVVNDLKDFIKK